VFLLPLLAACGPTDLAGKTEGPLGYYELGWPIDACSADFPDPGTGAQVGDTLGQYTFTAQTGETVSLHDWCDHVVYIEIGYTT
jgi:hypothetical protein